MSSRILSFARYHVFCRSVVEQQHGKEGRRGCGIDLAARGLDVPGVTAVIQLQFAGNVVVHLHRMGRCGRASNRDGRVVVFYGGR